MVDSQAHIVPVHTLVSGRARLQVAGLYRSAALKKFLEASVPDGNSILHASASVHTGTILVRFSSSLQLSAVIARVEFVVLHFSTTGRGEAVYAPRPDASLAGHEWHQLTPSEVAVIANMSPADGLTASDAAERLHRYGANLLPTRPVRSPFLAFLDQFRSLPVLLLLASGGLSLATGGFGDALAIATVVVLNAAIGFFTERRAESRICALLTGSRLIASVWRDARLLEVGVEEVVPGDLLQLQRGCQVVADARIIEAHTLRIDESALTGESFPVEKTSAPVPPGVTPIADRVNMAYRGTVVTGGDAIAIVVATGRHTEIGALQLLTLDAETPQTPLQRQLAALGRQQVWLASSISGAVFVAGLLRGYSALEMLKATVSLAVASIPEGLPVIATTALASGLKTMLDYDILIRRLGAIETLGAIQVACLDKTGTLTRNRLSVVSIFAGRQTFPVVAGRVMNGAERPFDTDPDLRRLLEVCVLCTETSQENNSSSSSKSPTEAALLETAVGSGADPDAVFGRYPLRAQRYRTEDRNYMATVHETGAGALIAIKGNPLEVLELCSLCLEEGQIRPLSAAARAEISAANGHMAARALRVLGMAYVETDGDGSAFEGDAVWIGLVGMADQLREGISDFVRELRRAGIAPMMITGDQAETAGAIALELGMNPRSEVLSRVNPSDKLRIVQRLQSSGYVVAMTGDGINDAPALKAADVGITLGRDGTKVAQDVADVVLADDNIAALIPAITEGRRVAANVHHAVDYITATNFSEILVVFTSIAVGLGQPLNTRQLLWINLLSDVFPELAFALEPGDANLLERPPRDANTPLIGPRDLRRLATESGVMSASALAAYGYGVGRYGVGPRSSTVAFISLAAAQLLHALIARSPDGRPAAAESQPRSRVPEAAGAGLAILLASQLMPGVGELLGTIRLGLDDLLVSAGGAAVSLAVNQMLKRPPREEERPAGVASLLAASMP
jgi:Ca2+-transporting ATPase